MIKEIIVVEGRDDLIKVKAALECEVVITHGFGFGEKLLTELKALQEKRGLIILTDPDHAGKMIRRKIEEAIPEAKHAFISREKATKNDDIGIENATFEEIRNAIERAKPVSVNAECVFSKSDLLKHGLIGDCGATDKRNRLTELLKIGHCNGKQLLNKLNNFGITREEFERAIHEVEKIGR